MEYDSRVMYTTGQKSGVMTISKGKESDEISGNIELIDIEESDSCDGSEKSINSILPLGSGV